MSPLIHTPVMVTEVIAGLALDPSATVVDGTMGFGGHSNEIVSNIPTGKLIGIDRDPVAVSACQNRFSTDPRVRIHHGSFCDWPTILGQTKVDAILVDLGMSSFHLDGSNRGFSFQKSEPLDMRMDPQTGIPASEWIHSATKSELRYAFQTYGDVYPTDRLVDTIIATRQQVPIRMTDDLVAIIKKSFYFQNHRNRYMNMVSRVFQAIRIVVNDELTQLDFFLNNLHQYLNPGGRVAIIAFHPSEDRQVKQFFINNPLFSYPAKKFYKPTKQEVTENLRAKSAILRVATYVGRPR